jgi:hypothetical protein
MGAHGAIHESSCPPLHDASPPTRGPSGIQLWLPQTKHTKVSPRKSTCTHAPCHYCLVPHTSNQQPAQRICCYYSLTARAPLAPSSLPNARAPATFSLLPSLATIHLSL